MTKNRRLAELQKAFDAHQERKKEEAHGYGRINFRRKKNHANFAIKNIRILEGYFFFHRNGCN